MELGLTKYLVVFSLNNKRGYGRRGLTDTSWAFQVNVASDLSRPVCIIIFPFSLWIIIMMNWPARTSFTQLP